MNFDQWLVVIPARLKSERLPKKPLADLAGKPLIVRVFENLTSLRKLGAQLVVAIDHQETAEVCQRFSIPFVMTDEALPSGTDRCNEAARSYHTAKFILNVQGDEPFIKSGELIRLMEHMQQSSSPMGTLGYRNCDWNQFNDPNVVKIVCNDQGAAIYFSRSPIPFDRDARSRGEQTTSFWQHLGVYAFKRDALSAFCAMAPATLEKIEKLEQLRAVSAGWSISVVEASSKSLGIDTPADLMEARKHLNG